MGPDLTHLAPKAVSFSNPTNQSSESPPDLLGLPSMPLWVPNQDPLILLVYAKEGVGKTGLGFTFPEPILIYDLEHNSRETRSNPAFRNKDIRVAGQYLTPSLDNRGACKAEANRFLSDYHGMLRKAKAAGVKATFMIDSVTLLWDLIRYGLVEDMDDAGRVRTAWLYGPANQAMENIFKKTRELGFNMIVTARAKSIWIKNEKGQAEKTEKFEADVKDCALFESSIIIQMDLTERLQLDGSLKPVRVSTIRKIQPCGRLQGRKMEDLDYKKLMDLIVVHNQKGE